MFAQYLYVLACCHCEKDDVEGIALFFNIHVESAAAQKLASQKGSIHKNGLLCQN